MKKINAQFPGASDAELCLMKLAPYISSYTFESSQNSDFIAMTTPDCGLNSFWGVEPPPFELLNGYTPSSHNPKVNIDYLNKFDSSVKKIFRQYGGRISE